MADINLERKDTTVWPWVVGLLALALIIWGVWAATDGNDIAFGDDPVVTDTRDDRYVGAPESVREFRNDCAVGMAPGQPGQMQQRDQMGQQQDRQYQDRTGQAGRDYDSAAEYTEHCIDRMLTAMEDVVGQDDATEDRFRPEIDRLRDRADALDEDDAESPQYSMHVQEILNSAASLIEQIQQSRPGAAMQTRQEVQELQRMAGEFRTEVPVHQQTGELGQYFQRAGTALQMLGEEE